MTDDTMAIMEAVPAVSMMLFPTLHSDQTALIRYTLAVKPDAYHSA